MPLLETANGDPLVWDYTTTGFSGLLIANYGNLLDINLPQLSNTSEVEISGLIGR
jgi:hypothetical protein